MRPLTSVRTVPSCLRYRARYARRTVICRAGEPDAHPADRHDGAVLEVRQRRSIAAAQIGGIERKLGLAHALEEGGLSEIELVVARREDVRRDQIGQREDVRAAVEARHKRRRKRIAGMRQDHVALGALGLDNGGESGDAAAAFPVGHHLICDQIDVIDQQEADARGLGTGRTGAEERDEQADGEMAKGGHGGEAGFQSDAVGLRA
jgi:hypothetical protein